MGRPERLVATVRPVVVDRGGIDDPGAAEEPETLAAAAVRRLGRADAPGAHDRGVGRHHRVHGGSRRAAERHLGSARSLREDGRRLLAHPETGRPDPCPTARVASLRPGVRLQLLAEGEPADASAGEVVADVHDVRGSLLHAEHRVEGRDAVRLGRRHREPLTDVVETPAADPPDTRLEGVQRREQQVSLFAGIPAATHDAEIRRAPNLATHPAALGRTQQRVDGGALGIRWCGVHQMEIHAAPLTRRPRRSPPEASPPARRWP